MKRIHGKAEEVAAHPFLATSLETMNYRVRLAALMQLPVEQYLGRMNRLLDAQVKMMAAQVEM